MYEENDGVIVESSATEEVVESTENTDAVTEETPAVSTDDAPVKEEAVTEEESAPSKKDAQARIRQLVEERDRAREAEAFARGQLEAKKVEAPVKQETDAQPRAEQFEVYDDYVRAVGRWEARQEFNRLDAEREQRVKERETKTREEQVEAAFKAKVQEFKAKTPDFDSVVNNPSLQISKTMYEAMRESEVGEQIAYHLGKNPAEAARIAALSPIASIREIGKLEAKLSIMPPPAQTLKPSNAPAPPAVVGGSSGGTVKDTSKMNDDEWFEWEKTERLKKLQAQTIGR